MTSEKHESGISRNELSIAVPLYNEERNIESLVKNLTDEFDRNGINYQLVLVNNGSKDNTPSLIDRLANENPRIKTVHIERNIGYGWGISRGLGVCDGDYVGYMWGDEQVTASDVLKIFNKIKKDGLDFCKARRVVREDGLQRKIITRVYNGIFPLFYPVKTKDINGCPKILKKDIYQDLNIISRDWFIDAEIMIKCIRKGVQIGEVPVVFHTRSQGKSNVSFRTIVEFIKNLIKFKFKGEF